MAFLPMGQVDPAMLQQMLLQQQMQQRNRPPQNEVGSAFFGLADAITGALGGYAQMQQGAQQKEALMAALLGTPGAPQMGSTLPGDAGGLQGMTRGPSSPGLAAGMDRQTVEAMMALPGGSDALVQALVAQRMPRPVDPLEAARYDLAERRFAFDQDRASQPETLSPYEAERLKREDRRIALQEQRLNKPPGAKSEPLVEVFDPDSPTGTRFVPRSQAAGRAGKPASGLAIETSPDGSVRVTQGREQGRNKQQTPEQAAKTQLVEQGVGNVQAVRDAIFDETGGVNRVLLGKMSMNVPGEGRAARMKIVQAIRAKLRIETGAVISDEEIDAEYGQFFPSVTDTAENAAERLNQLEEFLKGTSANIRPAEPRPGGAPAKPGPDASLEDLVEFYAGGGRF